MSDSYNDSAKGAVENSNYCMPSMQKRNVEEMNQKMGYHNMGDRANTPKPPTAMKAQKVNKQVMK